MLRRAHRLSVTALLGIVALGCSRPPPSQPAAVAVMYFENLSDPADADRLGRMLTGLLTDELAAAEGSEVINQQRLYDAASRFGGDGISDRETAAAVARDLGISIQLIGRVTRGEDAVLADVRAIDTASGRVIATQEAHGQGAGDVFAVAEALGRQLQAALSASPAVERSAPPPGSLTRRLTGSLEAYRAYVEGEQMLHRKHFEAAAASFRQAIAIDPRFALAHYRLSITGSWSGRDEEEALGAARRAVELAGGLPLAQRQLFEAAALFLEGRFSAAIPRVEAILAEDPENKEALYLLSEMYLHSGLDTNVPAAVEAMLVLADVDPDFRLLRDHLVLALVMLGRWGEAESYLDAWSSQMPAAEIEQIRTFALALGYRADEVPELSEPLAGTVAFSVQFRGMVTMITGRWEQARELTAIEVEEGYPRTLQLLNRGDFYAYTGAFEAARKAYAGAAAVTVVPGHEGVQTGFVATVHEVLAELHALGGDLTAARAESERAVALQPRHPAHHYHAGRLALFAGDRAAAEEHLRVLRASTSSRGILAPLYEQALAAELLLADGEADRAREKLTEVVGSGALLHELFASNSSAGALFRDALARACRARWDQAGEIAALEGLVAGGFERLNHPTIYVPALYRLGELYLESGDEDKARQYFERFLELWGAADWSLPEVAEARDHLGL
jgi:tetratricopeptide (TPR) repeat protein